ncbi:MAG: aminoacyl-tRNA hydrolase [Pseudomonadota bacterium]
MAVQLFVGLGNPGAGYAGHRHNVGFMAVDAIADKGSFGSARNKFQAVLREGRPSRAPNGDKVLLLKPQTFMNASGQSVGEAARFFKVGPQSITVFYDELDLAPGKVRVKRGGGAAGHNGIRSIANHIGPDFRRVRIGIGHPGDKARVQGHVLSDFAKADGAWLGPLLNAMGQSAHHLLRDAEAQFMNDIAMALRGTED